MDAEHAPTDRRSCGLSRRGGRHDGDADLVIAAQGDKSGDDGGRTIWLRTEPEPAGKKDESIYRYDRAGLLMALKSAGAGSGK